MKLSIKIVFTLLIILALTYIVPFKTTQQTTIKASFTDVANQINVGDYWKNWYIPLKYAYGTSISNYKLREDYKNHKIYIQTNDNYYEITKHSPAWIELQIGKNIKTTCIIRFIFDKKGKVSITETQSTSLFNYLFKLVKCDMQYYGIVKNLKPFMETPKLYYGFDIKRTAVPDTAFVTFTETVSKNDIFKMLDNSYKMLRNIANTNKVKVIGNPYLSYSTKMSDSIKITAMLVINKKLELYNRGNINFFAMPKNGHMLVAHYHGEYGNSTSAYTAMEKYVTDNNLSRVYVPFERFLGKVPKTEQSVVDMDVFYPIY